MLNLFGAMRHEEEFLTIFQNLFDGEATKIDEIICEWAPGPRIDYLNDGTAFDAIVFYTTDTGPAFMGIETKYTEPFSRERYDETTHPAYGVVTRTSGWFAKPESALQELPAPASNQLWRNVMLAAALEMKGYKGNDIRGSVAVVCLEADRGAEKACRALDEQLAESHRDRLQIGTLQQVLSSDVAETPELDPWRRIFGRRYLGQDTPDGPYLPDEAGAERDPVGPRFGRQITETYKIVARDS